MTPGLQPAPLAVSELVLHRTCELATIPAPPLDEARRTALVENWWASDGLDETRVDDVGNVWSRVRRGADPAVLVCAHLDTVFPADVDHTTSRDGDFLRGRGVGDNSVAVATLSTLHELLPADTRRAVWLLASVGEEGEGDLLGIRRALDVPPAPIGTLIALEGNWLGRVGVVGVGSVRLRTRWRGPGGHAWERADAPNVVHCAARAVALLDRLPERREAKLAVNVGIMRGGEAINARAADAHLDLDLRAEAGDDLAFLEREARRILAASVDDGVTLDVAELGRRPAGRIEMDHPLVRASAVALRDVDVEPAFVAGSTDANAAYARGIAAVTLGVTEGAGEHTPDEWIAVSPIATGLAALAKTVGTVALEGAGR